MKVSAIMPARGRPKMTARAVESFLSQTYPNKELLIMDDEEDPACPPCLSIPGVQIFRQGGRMTIAEKRNALCERATGELIVHFDSDDWSACNRIADQVNRLVLSGLAVTGYHSILFHDLVHDAVLKYRGYVQTYAVGTTLLFRREWWAEHRFPETRRENGADIPRIIGEDTEFVTTARKHKQVTAVDGGQIIVATIHKENTCPKDRTGNSFQPMLLSDLPKEYVKCKPGT